MMANNRMKQPLGGAGSLMESLEPRRLMTFTPILSSNALTSDQSQFGTANVDPNLVNPVGITVGPGGKLFTADNATGDVTSYNAAGVPQPAASPLVGTIPAPSGAAHATPTGIVAHAGNVCDIAVNGANVPSAFLTATEDGTIAGYNPAISATAAIAVDHSQLGDVFKGLTILGSGTGAKIYATDFHNDRVEVFNSKFQQVVLKGGFVDREVPAGFSPFGIQAIHGKIYVTYARQDSTQTQDNPGTAQGIVDVYSARGKLIRRVATGGDLNSPWGLAVAPASWWIFKKDLLVGNQGDGTISIFDKFDNLVGQFPDNAQDGGPLTAVGLWGLQNGTGKARNEIFFTSAPNSKGDGVLGELIATKVARVRR